MVTRGFGNGWRNLAPKPVNAIISGQKRPQLGPRKKHCKYQTIKSPEGPARHLDASRQKLTPYCLVAIFDSQLPSPKLSLKMPPKLPLPHNRGHFFLFQNCPRGEGNCAAIERQKLSRGNFCLAASRCSSAALWVREKKGFVLEGLLLKKGGLAACIHIFKFSPPPHKSSGAW